MTLQYGPLWKGTEGVLATYDMSRNRTRERNTATRRSLVAARQLLTSVSSLRGVWGTRSKQQRIIQLPMLGNISVRVVCFAPFFKLVGTVIEGEDAGVDPTVPDSLFSVFPSSLRPVLFLAVDRDVLMFFFRTLHIWVCTCGSRSVFLPELIAIGWTLPAVHCVFAVQLPLKSHRQSSVLFFLLPAAPCSLFVPRHFRQERAVGWRRFTLRSSTRPLSV